jgi:hypothetical protein
VKQGYTETGVFRVHTTGEYRRSSLPIHRASVTNISNPRFAVFGEEVARGSRNWIKEHRMGRSTYRPRALHYLAGVLMLAGSAYGAGRAVKVQPTPAWVTAAPASPGAATKPDEATNGILYLLDDRQERVSERSTEHYYHYVYKLVSSAGLDIGSQLKPEFEPTYEELVFHQITIRRGSARIDALRPQEIKLIDKETNLDEREYNGRLSALLFLNDVRVGDIVDYAYSINGANPVMRGRFATRLFLAEVHPVLELRRRVLWQSSREPQMRRFNTTAEPVVRDLSGARDYTWELQNVPALELDDETPSWFDPVPIVQLGDFTSWEDVVGWAVPLFKTTIPIAPGLSKQILEWRTKFSKDEDRLLAALRFVQDEVRYLAIEIGPSSHRPNQPSEVFKKRFGDCKDKSLLLVTILNELGIEAYPALVDTEARQKVGELQPSPFDFDHCIVKAQCGEKTYWLDPTITLQRGTIESLSPPDEAVGLVLKEGNRDLDPIPHPTDDQVLESVSEIYTLENYSAPALLEVTTTYHGARADSQRYSLTEQPLSELSKDFLNYYAAIDPSISADGPPVVTDDQVSNTLVVKERYRIPDFLSTGSREVFADRINEELAKPSIRQRSMPLAVSYPIYVEQSIEVHLPYRTGISPASGTLSDDATYFKYDVGVGGNAAHLKFAYRTLKDHVDTAGVANHLAMVNRIRNALNHRVTRASPPEDHNDRDLGAAALALAVLAGPFVLFGGLFLATRRRRASERQRTFKQVQQVVDGEGPENPIQILAADSLAERLRSMRCRCGAEYRFDEGGPHQERFVYDGRRLIAVTLKCETCGVGRDAYFAPSGIA